MNNTNKMSSIKPWFVTGLTDAEGCFQVRINKSTGHRLGWQVRVVFSIELHRKDVPLLKQMKSYFGDIGSITFNKRNMSVYSVTSLDQIWTKIIPHFDKYKLITQKKGDYLLFRKVAFIIKQSKHLTKNGLQKILNIKASLNWGISDTLISNFVVCVPVKRPVVKNQKVPNPYWMAGFTSGEGCFFVNATDSKTYKGYSTVSLTFDISQHSRDEQLIKSFVSFFDCGKIHKNRDATHFCVQNISAITNQIIPFFTRYKVNGVKYLDYMDWCEVAGIVKTKGHLTVLGWNIIYKIKKGMNKGRIWKKE